MGAWYYLWLRRELRRALHEQDVSGREFVDAVFRAFEGLKG